MLMMWVLCFGSHSKDVPASSSDYMSKLLSYQKCYNVHMWVVRFLVNYVYNNFIIFSVFMVFRQSNW